MAFTLTDEQAAIRDAARSGQPLRVIAYAGTGKTTTLEAVARHALGRRSSLYLAFNRQTAVEAAARFPPATTAKTAHALAHAAQIPWISSRDLVSGWMPLRAFIERECAPDIAQARAFGPRDRQILTAVLRTLSAFCHSADDRITAALVPGEFLFRVPDPQRCLSCDDATIERIRREYAQDIARIAQQAWDAMMAPTSRWPITHDVYLKRWQLTHPVIPYDVILFDEAQDAWTYVNKMDTRN